MEQNGKIYFFSPQKTLQTRFRHLLPFSSEIIKSSVQIFSHALDGGFSSRAPLHPALFLSDHEVFGFQKKKRPHFFQTKQKNFHTLDTLSEIQEGHLVVHFQHGIGRYEGLKRLRLLGSEMDFLVLSYAGTDRLYLPVFRLQEIQKYIGSQKVTLDKLGSNRFQKRKQNARKAAKKLAFDLLSLYAKRHASSPKPLPQRDELYESFEAKFPYQETPDQLKSLREIFSDLDKPKLMDRLLCGDVGFGKTEIAMRVAFHFVQNGYQVAALVPTTLLCLQHSRTFKERFAPEGIRVASLSRLTSTKKRKEIIQDVQTHQIDILIGTHALLNKKIKFAKLGFLIIDEEHRFGVEQKEKIQNLKTQTHVLTMTATPIPRTLALTLSSIRSISLIQTPPEDRFPVQTFVVPFQKGWIQKAIEQELKRGGQLFFVHPHVKTLPKWEVWFQKNFPDLKIGTVHGQLPKATLQKTMLDFYHQRINLLLCTSIIESGLDVPTANTMIIDRADLFGLAQLYQLRGRIGRSYQKAFCYLMIHPGAKLTAPAQKRLETLQRFFELGSGFAIAAQDLEIRGGGDLLGAEQSGHIQSVGFDLFRKMVQEAIADMKQDSTQKQDLEPTTPSTEIHSSAAAYLPKHYIAHSQEKLRFYRILSKVQTISAIDDLEAELQDRFGALPSEAKNLLWITRIKTLLLSFELKTLWLQKNHVQLEKPPHSEKSAHLFQHLLQNPSVKILTPIKIQIPFSQIDTKKNPSFTFLEKIYLFFQKQLTQNSALL